MRQFDIEDTELHGSFEPLQLPEDPADFLKEIETARGARDDGLFLLYEGKYHTVVAETEAGKTWLALLFCQQEIEQGNDVGYIDFEDSAQGIIGRLHSLGAEWSAIRDHFNYIRPEAPLSNTVEYAELLDGCTLVILDGVTEALALHGMDSNSGTDFATFRAIWARPLTDQGTTVLSLDHVAKNRDSRGRMGIGSVHKINTVDGAQFVLINQEPFGRGRKGHSALLVAKDRFGHLRKHGEPGKDGLTPIADLILDSLDEDNPQLSLADPAQNGPWKPTAHMENISRLLERSDGPMTRTAVYSAVSGRKQYKCKALDNLIEGGYARTEGRNIFHAEPYRKGDHVEQDEEDSEI